MAIIRRILIAIVLLVLLVYAGDYLSLRYRIPGNRSQFGSVHVERYYAVPQKNGKTEFIDADPETQACVQSLFPHYGDRPCWYVRRNLQQRINM